MTTDARPASQRPWHFLKWNVGSKVKFQVRDAQGFAVLHNWAYETEPQTMATIEADFAAIVAAVNATYPG